MSLRCDDYGRQLLYDILNDSYDVTERKTRSLFCRLAMATPFPSSLQISSVDVSVSNVQYGYWFFGAMPLHEPVFSDSEGFWHGSFVRINMYHLLLLPFPFRARSTGPRRHSRRALTLMVNGVQCSLSGHVYTVGPYSNLNLFEPHFGVFMTAGPRALRVLGST